MAAAGEVLITDAVYGRLNTLVSVEPAGTRTIKGKIAPVKTYRVTSIKQRAHVKAVD
jgi:class 3 adenylate cyclase